MDMKFAESLKKQRMLEKRKKMWLGGEVESDSPDSDEVLRKNSSGEPHTNELLQSKKGMEYDNSDSLSDHTIDSKAGGNSDITDGNDPRGEDKRQPDPYKQIVMNLFKGGLVAQSNDEPSGAGEQEEPYDEHEPMDLPDEEEGFGKESSVKNAFAMHLKKKMRGY